MFNIFYFIVFDTNWLHLGITDAVLRENAEDK